MALVSVIVPVYNTAKYLKQCIKSLLKQTLSDIEIICVDDGSTDASAQIIDGFAKRNKNIKVIHKSNAGYGHTLNAGIKNASGEYIGVVDSDDYVSADMYDTLYRSAKENDLDFIKSDFYEIRAYRGKVYKKIITGFDDKTIYNRVLNPSQTIEAFNFITMNVWTGLFRRSFLKKNNLRFNETPGAAFQDSGFWFQTLCSAERVMFTDEAFYRYRKDNPKSSVNDPTKVYDIVREYNYIKRFLVSRPAKYKLFFETFVVQKYYAYMDAYMRIGEEFKQEFLCKCAQEFSEDLRELKADSEVIDKHAFEEMIRIIDSHDMYYYERTLDDQTRNYEVALKDLEFIRGFIKEVDKSC